MNCEMQGVKYVELAISKTDYLVPHINFDDREPSWDGDVDVYRKPGDVHAKADLILKVPVQIKGHKENDLSKQAISYPVEYTDMQNYLDIGGTVFLVVYVDEEGENHKIYYAEFLPYGLKKLLKRQEGKKTKNITMKLLSEKKDDVTDLFLAFARNMKKQRPAIYSEEVCLEEMIKEGTVPELSIGFSCVPKKDVTPFELILKGNMYLYAKLPYGLELPVEHFETVDMAGATISAEIVANGKKFYDAYEVVHKQDVIELHFGKSTKHVINRKDNTKQKFNFTLAGTLSERIRDEEFILSALTAKQFEVDGMVCPLNEATPEEIAAFNVPARIEHLEWLKTVKTVLDALDVKGDLDCACLTEKDEENIQLLKRAMLDGERVPLKNTDNAFGFFNIGNLNILVGVLKREDGKFDIYNYNETPVEVKAKSVDNNEYPSSYHVLLKRDAILKCSNLNYDKMIEQLKSVPSSACYSEQVTLLLLELLGAYDDSGAKRKEILEASITIAKWLLEEDEHTPRNLLVLNYYQAIKRKRDLNEEEITELLRIVESDSASDEIYTGAYLLLGNQEAAKIHFVRIDGEQQKVFRNYPIFRFWKETKEVQ